MSVLRDASKKGVPVLNGGSGISVYYFAEFDSTAQMFDWCVVLKPEMIHIGPHVRIDSFVKLEGGSGMSIGRYVHIASFAHIGIGGGETIIGEFAAITSGAKILSGSNMKTGYSMSAAAPAELMVIERTTTRIGARAFIGANAVVLPGVTVGTAAIIGAGAVVTEDVPDGEIWAGVPAKRIGMRQEASRD